MNNLHVKTGDNVMIISGKDKGHTGKVLQVSPAEGKVIVEGQNMVTKHVKPRRQGEQGGIVKAEGAIYASKVMGFSSCSAYSCFIFRLFFPVFAVMPHAIYLVLIFVVFLACTRSVVPGINTPFAIIRVRGE